MGYERLQAGGHIAVPGMRFAHPIAHCAGLGDRPADIGNSNPAKQFPGVIAEQEEAVGMVEPPFLGIAAQRLQALFLLAQRAVAVCHLARHRVLALLHDLGEALITDLPPQVKQLIGREQVKDAERRAGEALLEDAPAPWREAFAQSQHQGSLEGRILKAADQIQMLIKALQYKHQRRGEVSRFFKLLDRVDDQGIALVGALFEAIRQAHERDAWPLAAGR